MRTKNIKPGDVLELARHVYRDSVVRIEAWTVTGIYEDFILCERNGIRECFTVDELIQLGYEKQEITNGLKRKKSIAGKDIGKRR